MRRKLLLVEVRLRLMLRTPTKRVMLTLLTLALSVSDPACLDQAMAQSGDTPVPSKDFTACIADNIHDNENVGPQDSTSAENDASRSTTLKCLEDETRRLKESIRTDYEVIVSSGDADLKKEAEEGQKIWADSLLPGCQREGEQEARAMVEAGVSGGGDKELSLKECLLNGTVARSLDVRRLRLKAKIPPAEANSSQEMALPQ